MQNGNLESSRRKDGNAGLIPFSGHVPHQRSPCPAVPSKASTGGVQFAVKHTTPGSQRFCGKRRPSSRSDLRSKPNEDILIPSIFVRVNDLSCRPGFWRNRLDSAHRKLALFFPRGLQLRLTLLVLALLVVLASLIGLLSTDSMSCSSSWLS